MAKGSAPDVGHVVRRTVPCTCKSEYQDRKYGHGMRVVTTSGKSGYRQHCTVCGKDHR
jgi:hypothetical protein